MKRLRIGCGIISEEARVELRRMGTTELQLSVVGFGGFELGNAGHGRWQLEGSEPPTPEEIDVALRAALDGGMNWIDTSEQYHESGNESAIGDAIRRVGADDLLVCTKLWPSPPGSGFDRDGVRRGIRGSLKRLGRDHVDIYLLHQPDDEVPLEVTWATMLEAHEQGLARFIGLSNFDRGQIERALAVGPLHVLQTGLSMVDYLDDRDLIAWCGAQGIGVQCYEPIGNSILTGAITRETDVDALWGGHLKEWSLFGRLFEGNRFDRSMDVVDGLREMAARWGSTMVQLALAWVIHQPGVSAALAGSRNPAHIADNAAAGDLRLDRSQLEELEALVPLGPAFA